MEIRRTNNALFPPPVFELLRTLSSVGFFEESMLIGSWVMPLYREFFDIAYVLRTMDIDFAVRSAQRLNGAHLPNTFITALESKGIMCNWVSEDYRSKKSHDITTDRVTISTIHSVKGLDYACVFIVGLDLIEPGERWSEEQIRSLTYVAMTRARYYLFIPYIDENEVIHRLLS
jgi:superfamily I DNA and RNA helicase